MAVDPITLQVIQARLAGIVQEMQNSLFRTGYSTIIRESQDASVVSHAVCTLSKTALARRYLAMMSSALAVQTKGLGFWL
jgi:N-methylhydantoinase B/oxoprolinase/acetone carboxylase alpha subunit